VPPRRRTTGASTVAPRKTTAPSAPRRPTAITNLQDTEAPRYRNWMVYGQSDAGKTVLAGTAPKALFLTTDVEGTESAKELGSTADELRIGTFTEYVEAVRWLVYGGGVREYDWVNTDTISELEELCWQEQLVSDDVKRASKYQPNKADYPLVWAKVYEQLMLLCRAPVNTLFLAHPMRIDRETDDGEDTVTLAMPAIGSRKRGDLSMKFCAQLGMVGYMRKVSEEGGGTTRQLLTESTNRWVARDRSTRLGSGMSKPTIPALLAKMEASATTAAPRRVARRARR
jgi:hypothetical protein